ncbi:MAG TPA: outer membrane lipoprotein LolB [Anaerolineae bacterium]|nr:outer membrane lipoprotein LolB [Anaerolineae bacterium]
MTCFPRFAKVFLPALLLGVLTACAVVPGSVSPDRMERRWQAHLTRLQAVHSWRLSGRLAVRGEDDGWQAALRWRQGESDYEIVIQGPLGQGTARLVGNGAGVVLHLPGAAPRAAADAELLLASELGWWVPVKGLVYWLRGLPEPNIDARRVLDARGRLARLEQQGWRIDYQRYRTVSGVDLPAKMVLEHADPKLRLRLVVGRWEWGQG